MRYSLSGSTGLTWSEIRDAAQLGEQLGFDSFFAADHLMAVAGFDEDAGLLDAVSLLLALAPVTTTLRLGAMVSPITVRHPVVLARAMQTLDLISEGRAEVGVGAGWSQSEHDIFGLPFPPASRRLELLEDACRTLVSLWEGPDPVHKQGPSRCAAPGSVHDRSNDSPRFSWPVRPITRSASPPAGAGPGMRPVPRPSWGSGWSSSERRR